MKATRPKSVNIDYELFISLLRFHLGDCLDEQSTIINSLNAKLDKMIDHDLYTKFKTSPSLEDRERARQEYLNRKGIPESFRY